MQLLWHLREEGIVSTEPIEVGVLPFLQIQSCEVHSIRGLLQGIVVVQLLSSSIVIAVLAFPRHLRVYYVLRSGVSALPAAGLSAGPALLHEPFADFSLFLTESFVFLGVRDAQPLVHTCWPLEMPCAAVVWTGVERM